MPTYPIEWKGYRLPGGSEFTVAICGNTGRICKMYLGSSDLSRSYLRQVKVQGQDCISGEYCLDLDCPFNKTSRENLVRMLDMPDDEVLDEETAKLWGTDSMVDGLVKFVERLNREMTEEAKAKAQAEPKPAGDSGV